MQGRGDAVLSPTMLALGCLALFLITSVRVMVLQNAPVELFFDEAQYWAWSERLDFGYFSKPPLLAWIIRLSTEFCGNSEACIRLPSAVLYALTGLTTGLLAARLARRSGISPNAAFFWTAILFATMPGVTFGTRIISTDAALLFFFALALFALDRFRERPTVLNAAFIGAAIGLGAMAKYAMAYFILCAVVWILVSVEGRRTLLRVPALLILPAAFLFVLPNLWWNQSHSWITFKHTQDNAKWEGLNFNFGELAEFTGAQIGILGPVLFIGLVFFLSKRIRAGERVPAELVFLFAFSLPVIAILMGQSLISRAHANWAAVAYVALAAASVLVLLKVRTRGFLLTALGIHLAFAGILAIADLNADRLVKQPIGASYKRVFGWRALSQAVIDRAKETGAKTIVADRRNTAAQLLYHLRDTGLTVRSWPADGIPGHYFEMAHGLSERDRRPVLVISACDMPNQPQQLQALEVISIPVRSNFSLTYYPYLSGNPALHRDDVC
ncbi:MAG: glycosyltransferase family 39 protein [Pseudomonadota bacterium]